MARTLLGKIAFITGAGSGIGQATCNILAKEGASIIAADQNLKNAEETVKNMERHEDQDHLSLNLDVANLDSIKKALNLILEQYNKPPSIIVNSAGITRDNFLLKLSESDFEQVIDINLKGTFLIIQTFANAIIEYKSQASIINISSIVGKYGNIGQSNYCSSKAGVEALTKTAAKELGKFGIRVNCILPGIIATPMTVTVPDKVKEKFLAQIALGRFGKAEEVAKVIAFLASDKSSYVHAASIEVTGGL